MQVREIILRFFCFHIFSHFFFREVTCSPQSYCVVDDSTNSARCECNPGFEEYSLGSGGRTGCRDVDECARGIHDCSRMAECVNQVRDIPIFFETSI